ncbi:hypothetical protein DRQ25_07145 [Candidatus Fermentibacteria bacterium]|nr:MAG: hypothetical protein DRQ25_07145 [Candidatus Fermentibacteria bacterium]
MSDAQAWEGPFVRVFSINDLITYKGVTDNGRLITEIPVSSAAGTFEGDGFGNGRVVSPLENRDNYPFIEEGDVIYAFFKNDRVTVSWTTTVAIFIVEDIAIKEAANNTGTVTYSGSGIAVELQRKILKEPYISNTFIGVAPSSTFVPNEYDGEYHVALDAAHAQVDDYYNGGVLEIDGTFAVIDYYQSFENRAVIYDWKPQAVTGTNLDYTMYHGNAVNNIEQAIAQGDPAWQWVSSSNGTPNGSFHLVDGRKNMDLVQDIVKQSGDNWHWRTNMQTAERKLYWFDANAAPITSNIYLAAMSEFTHAELEIDPNKAPIISCTRSRSFASKFTRIICATDEGITLEGLTIDDIVLDAGFAVDFDNSTVFNSAAEAGLDYHQITEKTQSFSNMEAANDTPEAIKMIQVQLYHAAVSALKDGDFTISTYTVKTILLRDVNIGESLHLKWERKIGEELIWSVDSDLWIRKVSVSGTIADSVRHMTLELGESYTASPVDGNTALANFLKGQSGSSPSGITVIGGGGSGGIAYVGGPNIDIDHTLISFKADSHIESSMTFGQGTRFYFWDNVLERVLYASLNNGYLSFIDTNYDPDNPEPPQAQGMAQILGTGEDLSQ